MCFPFYLHFSSIFLLSFFFFAIFGVIKILTTQKQESARSQWVLQILRFLKSFFHEPLDGALKPTPGGLTETTHCHVRALEELVKTVRMRVPVFTFSDIYILWLIMKCHFGDVLVFIKKGEKASQKFHF